MNTIHYMQHLQDFFRFIMIPNSNAFIIHKGLCVNIHPVVTLKNTLYIIHTYVHAWDIMVSPACFLIIQGRRWGYFPFWRGQHKINNKLLKAERENILFIFRILCKCSSFLCNIIGLWWTGEASMRIGTECTYKGRGAAKHSFPSKKSTQIKMPDCLQRVMRKESGVGVQMLLIWGFCLLCKIFWSNYSGLCDSVIAL